jgi:hypothetical protein
MLGCIWHNKGYLVSDTLEGGVYATPVGKAEELKVFQKQSRKLYSVKSGIVNVACQVA